MLVREATIATQNEYPLVQAGQPSWEVHFFRRSAQNWESDEVERFFHKLYNFTQYGEEDNMIKKGSLSSFWVKSHSILCSVEAIQDSSDHLYEKLRLLKLLHLFGAIEQS